MGVTLIQLSRENESQAHVLLAVTVMTPEPHADPNDALLPPEKVVHEQGAIVKAFIGREVSAKRGTDSVALATVVVLSGAFEPFTVTVPEPGELAPALERYAT